MMGIGDLSGADARGTASPTRGGEGERFEHPTKMWACATHKQFTMQAVAVAIAKATWNWVSFLRGKSEEAMREVLGAGRGVQAGEVETPSRGGTRDEAGSGERRGERRMQ